MIIRLTPVSALKIFFTTQAIGLSLWLLRIPEVKSTIGLSLIDLSFALFMQPLGILFGFFLASSVIKLIGNKKSCLYFGPIFILSFVFLPFATNFLFLATILFLSGLICAMVEVSMNTIAANLEKNLKKIVKIVHSEVRKKMLLFLKKNNKAKIVILDIPLLLENKINDKNDILVFVDSKKSEILKRLKKRKNFNLKIFQKFKDIQLSSNYKKKKSHFIIKNNFRKKSVKTGINNVLERIT